MPAFCIAGRKGGSGKSSLCTSLACVAGDALIVDTDSQSTARHWFESRPDSHALPELAVAKPAEVGRAIKATARRAVFVDTPGDLSAGDAIQACDLTVLVVRPSIHDLRAVAGSVALLRGKPGVFLLNGAPVSRGTAESPFVIEARRALEAFKGVEVCPIVVHHRAAWMHCAIAGLGVTEWEDDKAADEIRRVWAWLSAR
jgi:chromosome partitioning protein